MDRPTEAYYLDIKAVNSPSDFVACIGKCIDYSDFDRFLIRLNNWCYRHEGFGGTKSIDLNCLHTNQKISVKYLRNNKKDDLIWKRSKIHSIDYTK
jgi:hypothetical protein